MTDRPKRTIWPTVAILARNEDDTYMRGLKLVVGLLLSSGCFGNGSEQKLPAQIAKGNQVRREFGIREIQGNWRVLRELGEEKWSEPNRNLVKKIHLHEKDRETEDGADIAPRWEQDYYYSGRSFVSMDGEGTGFEMLTISYSYDEKRFSLAVVSDNVAINGKVDSLPVKTKLGGAFDNDTETLERADEILSSFGIKSRK